MAHRILVIDDSRSTCSAISSVLEPRGCIVDFAHTRESGIRRISEKDYDLLILDIYLPDGNGIEMCRSIKRIPVYKYRPVLLLTEDTKNLENSLMVGASDYIVKPFKPVEMISRVFSHINICMERAVMEEERDELKKTIQKERMKLIEMENDLHKYFYQTSHTLRAPINTIKGLFNMLRADHPYIIENRYLRMIQESVDKMNYVNRQIANIGNLKAHVLKTSTINLRYLIMDLLEEKLSSDVDIDIDHNVIMATDAEVFTIALEPILDNAIYYSSIVGKSLCDVKIRLYTTNERTYLMIHDCGSGIAASHVPYVFDMFYKASEKSQGTGLGLFINKVALEMLNMDVRIHSKEGQYTKVIIDLTDSILTKD